MDTRERRAVGGEIRALSNLMRRKILEFAPPPEDPEFTEMQGQLLDFLSHHPDRDVSAHNFRKKRAFFVKGATVATKCINKSRTILKRSSGSSLLVLA